MGLKRIKLQSGSKRRPKKPPGKPSNDAQARPQPPAPQGPPLCVLLVEDNPGDVLLARKAFDCSNVRSDLHVVGDGLEALAFLQQRDVFENAPRPDLVLLDLRLPKKDGTEVLAELKEDYHLRRIPVVIFTSSTSDEDVARAYDLHANAFVEKPDSIEGFVEVIRVLERYAGGSIKLPPPS